MDNLIRRIVPVRSGIILVIFCLLLLLSSPGLPAGQETSHDILVIHSYHPSYQWTKEIHEGMISELDRWGESINLSIEYMDTKRILSPEHIESLITLYTAKYRQSPPDIIISSDNNAFSMLYGHREEIFGSEVPVVFCAVNFFHEDEWRGMTNILGVDEKPDLDALVRVVDSLHPEEPSIAFVNDQSVTGTAFRLGYLEWLAEQDNPDRYLLVDQGFPDDIIDQVKRLPGDWVLHYSVYIRDPEDGVYPPLELLDRLVNETDIPIYGSYRHMLGTGISGGPVIDGHQQGATAAEMAVDVLDGRLDPANLILRDSPSVFQFDYERLRDTRVSLGRLPDGSLLINEPDVFWKEYPVETAFGAATLVILLVGLVAVTWLLHQRSRLARHISILNTELEDRVRKRSEALKQAERDLVRAEKLSILGSLVAGIAHEVNTPLGMILTNATYLEDRLESELSSREEDRPEQEKLLADILPVCRSIVSNTSRTVDQVRNFKQVAVDQTGEAPRTFLVKELLDDFQLSMAAELKKAGISMEVDCSGNILIEHFPGDLWRVFANLVMNSLKHGFDPGKGGLIRISARSEGTELRFRYTDSGRGIPEGNLAKVFSPFFTTARQDGGTGLGLHVVRSIIVDRHGGTINVSNDKDGGVLFDIEMPSTSPALKS